MKVRLSASCISVRGSVNKPQGLVQSEGLGKLIKFNYLNGPQSQELPAYSTVPQPLCYHHSTSQKVAGSFPSEIINFFNLPNPSSHITTLGLTQPLTEISPRKSLWGIKCGQHVKLTNLPLSVSVLSRICGILSTSHNPTGLHGLLQGLLDFFSSGL
jgi:hypothetical protein